MENQDVQILQADTLKAITQAETETAMDIARRYPRDLKQVKDEVLMLSTVDADTAASCFYSKPVGKDEKGNETQATGESIRLAEIVAASYGNIRYASRIIGIDSDFITAQGVAIDIQKNIQYSVEVKRSIKTKKGFRYSASLIETTGKAASAIAIRDAIFKVIPKGFFASEIKRIQQVAAGTVDSNGNPVDDKTLKERAELAVQFFANKGVPRDRIFNALRVSGIDDIKEHHLIHLTGFKTALKDNEASLDEMFPLTTKEQQQEASKQAQEETKNKIIPQKEEVKEKASDKADASTIELIDEYVKKFKNMGIKDEQIASYYGVDHVHSMEDKHIDDMISRYDAIMNDTMKPGAAYPPAKK